METEIEKNPQNPNEVNKRVELEILSEKMTIDLFDAKEIFDLLTPEEISLLFEIEGDLPRNYSYD